MTTARELCHLARRQELTPAGNDKAKKYYVDAITLDPNYLPAYAELSYVFVREAQNGWSANPQASLAEARRNADRAVALSADPKSHWANDFRGHWYSAIVHWNDGNFLKGFAEYQAARAQITDPDRFARDTAELDADMAEACIYNGDHQQAIDLIEDAMKRYPDFPYWFRWNLARAYYMAGRYQDAIDEINRIVPNDLRLIVAASKAQLGETDYAKHIMAEFTHYDQNWTLARSSAYPYTRQSDRDHWLEGLSRAGLT